MRVELRAGVVADLGQRVLAAHRLAVGAVGGHRVVRVAAEDDPRGERDLLAGEAVRVAPAVPALVAGADDLADARHQAADAVEQQLALDRVRLDQLELLVGELGRLVQDLLGDRDLADVVEQRGELELLAVGLRDAPSRPRPRRRARRPSGSGRRCSRPRPRRRRRAASRCRGRRCAARAWRCSAPCAPARTRAAARRAGRPRPSVTRLLDGLEREHEADGREDGVDAVGPEHRPHGAGVSFARRSWTIAPRRCRRATWAAKRERVDPDVSRASAGPPARARRAPRRGRARTSVPARSDSSVAALARTSPADAPEHEAGGHEQRHERQRRQEEHGDEDELLGRRVAVPDLELDPRHDRVEADEQRDQERVRVALPRDHEQRRPTAATTKPAATTAPAKRSRVESGFACRSRAAPTSATDAVHARAIRLARIDVPAKKRICVHSSTGTSTLGLAGFAP